MFIECLFYSQRVSFWTNSNWHCTLTFIAHYGRLRHFYLNCLQCTKQGLHDWGNCTAQKICTCSLWLGHEMETCQQLRVILSHTAQRFSVTVAKNSCQHIWTWSSNTVHCSDPIKSRRLVDWLIVGWRFVCIFYSPKTAANTTATTEKAGHVQITTIHGFSGNI